MRTLVIAIATALLSSSAAGADWKVASDADELLLTLEGSPPLPTRQQPRAPALIVECKNGRVKLSVDARTPVAGPGDELHEHRFRARYDDGDFESLVGAIAKPSDPLFFPRPAAHFKRLMAARMLTVEVTPYRFSPAKTTFQVGGLEQHKELIDKYCRIK
jgi:hypothetical protein